MIAVDETRGAGADAEAARRFEARSDDLRVVRQAEIVVAGERDELVVALQRRRRIKARRNGEAALELPPLERRELVARELVERRPRAA